MNDAMREQLAVAIAGKRRDVEWVDKAVDDVWAIFAERERVLAQQLVDALDAERETVKRVLRERIETMQTAARQTVHPCGAVIVTELTAVLAAFDD